MLQGLDKDFAVADPVSEVAFEGAEFFTRDVLEGSLLASRGYRE